MIAIALALAIAAPASASNAGHIVVGVGSNTCGTWTVRIKQADQSGAYILRAWIAGYVTAIDTIEDDAGRASILEGLDVNAVMGWIDNYCAANPLDNLSRAGYALTTKLKAVRR